MRNVCIGAICVAGLSVLSIGARSSRRPRRGREPYVGVPRDQRRAAGGRGPKSMPGSTQVVHAGADRRSDEPAGLVSR